MIKKFFIVFVCVLSFLFLTGKVLAIDCEGDPPSGSDHLQDILAYQQQCEAKISNLQSQQKTLKSTISLLTSRINLTQAQISSTNAQIAQLEKDIKVLGGVITNLNQTLDELSVVFAARLRQAYKTHEVNLLEVFFTSHTFAAFQDKLRYLQIAQRHDQIVLHELESSRITLDTQKTVKQQKQAEVMALKNTLEQQKKTLAAQQLDKQQLLKDTQNNEARYQSLLAKAQAELQAIESIIAGKGSETEVGSITAGAKIASIIPGPSACSTGAHLHFEVDVDKVHQSPTGYLKSKDVIWNNAPDSPFSFTGSWDWPLNDQVRITQGYGHTSFSSRYANNFHTGIDMVNIDNLDVSAVRDGTLYRGSIGCGGGTLKYVHVRHKNENVDTYYLHVNYF